MFKKFTAILVSWAFLFQQLLWAQPVRSYNLRAIAFKEKQAAPALKLKETVLNGWHRAHGAHMAEFGGWDMPLYYTDPAEENLNTRTGASIFDESHMSLIEIKGKDAAGFVDYISSPNVDKNKFRPFKTGDVQYRFLLDENADIIDDIQVVKIAEDHFRLIVNAGNTDKVKKWLAEKIKPWKECAFEDLREAKLPRDQRLIFALQGTNKAQEILQQLTDFDLKELGYFKAAFMSLKIADGFRVQCLVQRTGYTGEDGFEIHINPQVAVPFWEKVISLGARPAGLQARDSLRLEAGLPLYGHEWRQEKDAPMPFEYRYGFALNLSREPAFQGIYVGKNPAIAKFRERNWGLAPKALVGIRVLDRQSIPHNGSKVFDEKGQEIGYVTSGAFSPSLNTAIGLVYIDKSSAAEGAILHIDIGGQKVAAKVVNTPFVNHIVPDRTSDRRETSRFFIPDGEKERQVKLEAIRQKLGTDTVDGLFGELKQYFHTGFDLPEPLLNNRELFRLLYGLSLKNSNLVSFQGGGYYDELPSDLRDYLLSRPEFLTAYTPYQPEISQGILRFLFLYQSLMAKLLDMDVVNASLYDGSSALAEGVNMACRATGKKTVVLVGAINPSHKKVIETYTQGSGIKIVHVLPDEKTGRIDTGRLKAAMTDDVASVIVQQPNFLGQLETEIDKIAEIAKSKKALLHIHSNDPMVFAKIKSPGSCGADITTAEGQAFVGSPYYGGNNLGIFGCKRNLVDFMPGRLVGQTTDKDGKTAFALGLTYREQHVARTEATSNVCTAAVLQAIRAAMYIMDMGRKGLSDSMDNSHQLAMGFAKAVADIEGFEVFSSGPISREVVVLSPISASELQQELLKRGIDAGFDISQNLPYLEGNLAQFSFTGRHTQRDLMNLIEALKKIAEAKDLGAAKEKAAKMPAEAPQALLRDTPLDIPVVSEETMRRIITEQAALNYNPVENPYPLGSCTMKYNPIIIVKRIAALMRLALLHPAASLESAQGTLQILHELGEYLRELTGMDATAVHPAAGAHGEFTGLLTIFKYHRSRGDDKRDVIITTDSAHGTNPASSAMAYAKEVIQVKTDPKTGRLDMESLKAILADPKCKGRIAAIMLTEPNTLGLFENLKEAADLVHKEGGLVYMDGANLNSIVGRIRPGDLGVDVLHINLHKTFATPHGGGGPGSGPICVKKELIPFLPNPRIIKKGDGYELENVEAGINVGAFLGNVPVSIMAYAYIRALGAEGLRAASGEAVLNANYLMSRLMGEFQLVGGPGPRMHEFVIDVEPIDKEKGVSANDFAKALQNFGIHPPTVYFPHINGVVGQSMMFEPTESMTLAELDLTADAMLVLKKIAYAKPELLKNTPYKDKDGLRGFKIAVLDVLDDNPGLVRDRKALEDSLVATPMARVNVSKVQVKATVPLKNSDIASILGIGEAELVAEKPAVTAPLYEYEDPVEGWSAKPELCELSPKNEEWARIINVGAKRFAVIGVTPHTVGDKGLNGVKKVTLPKVGDLVKKDQSYGTLLSDKADGHILALVTGRVVKINKFATSDPTDVNKDPFGRGWLFMVELMDDAGTSEAQGPAETEAAGIPALDLPITRVGDFTQGSAIVACMQLKRGESMTDSFEWNTKRMIERARATAGETGANLVIFPEALDRGINHPPEKVAQRNKELGRVAKELGISIGYCVLYTDDNITYYVVSPDGDITKFEKGFYREQGKSEVRMLTVGGSSVAILVCSEAEDLRKGTLSLERITGGRDIKGAQLLIVASNTFEIDKEPEGRHWVRQLSEKLGIPVAAVNLVSGVKEWQGQGKSCYVDPAAPEAKVALPENEEGVLLVGISSIHGAHLDTLGQAQQAISLFSAI